MQHGPDQPAAGKGPESGERECLPQLILESDELDRQLAQIAEGRKENARLLGELEEKEKNLRRRSPLPASGRRR